MYKKKGFTLAEVLITLAIIGVVAALTIPSVVNNYQKQQAVVKLKKQYSVLYQALNRAIVDYGPIQGWEFGNSQQFADNYLKPYLSITKDCGTDAFSDKDCSFKPKYLDNNVSAGELAGSRFYLKDGTFVLVVSQKDSGVMGGDETTVWHMYRTDVYVDINGKQGPNTQGKDIFIFTFTGDDDNYDAATGALKRKSDYTGKLLPKFFYNSSALLKEQCDKKTDYSGSGCTSLIVKDGWKINYDW